MPMKADVSQLLQHFGDAGVRESALCLATGWDEEKLKKVLASAQKRHLVQPSCTRKFADPQWISTDAVIARCPWDAAQVLAEIQDCGITTRELARMAGGSEWTMRALVQRLQDQGHIKQIAFDGLRKWVPASRVVTLSGPKPPISDEQLLALIEQHQPVKLVRLVELAERGSIFLRGRVGQLRRQGLVKHDVLGESWCYSLANYQRPGSDIGTEILMRCEDAGGDCLTWTGARSPQGHPLFRHKGKTARVDMVLWKVVHGLPLKPGHTLTRVCETPGCCNHDHHKQVTRGEAMRIAFAKLGDAWRQAQGVRVSKAVRAKIGALTPEQVEIVRKSDLSASTLAKQFGCTKGVISTLRRGESYRDYSGEAANPFEALIRRAAA